MNRFIILAFAFAALTASASARASEKCGAKEAVQWLACCPIPLKNGKFLETTCPNDFEDSDSGAKACYYDCAYKELGLMTEDNMLIEDKVQAFSQDYFEGHPDYQTVVKKAIEVAFGKIKAPMGKVKSGDKECAQTGLLFTLMSYNYVLRNCPNFVDSKQCSDLKASGC